MLNSIPIITSTKGIKSHMFESLLPSKDVQWITYQKIEILISQYSTQALRKSIPFPPSLAHQAQWSYILDPIKVVGRHHQH